MADTYEQEMISLPSEDTLSKEPIIIKGGTHPFGTSDLHAIKIDLGKLINQHWKWRKTSDMVTVTFNPDTSKFVIVPDPPNPSTSVIAKAVIARPRSRLGNLTIKGYSIENPGNLPGNPIVLKPNTPNDTDREISIDAEVM